MDTNQIRRFAASIGVVGIIIAGTGTTAPAAAGGEDGTQDRPCFAFRANWNTAEGPQPTCPVPSWQRTREDEAAPDNTGASRPVPGPRIRDFMP